MPRTGQLRVAAINSDGDLRADEIEREIFKANDSALTCRNMPRSRVCVAERGDREGEQR